MSGIPRVSCSARSPLKSPRIRLTKALTGAQLTRGPASKTRGRDMPLRIEERELEAGRVN